MQENISLHRSEVHKRTMKLLTPISDGKSDTCVCGTRWCPRCIAFDSRIYCEKEQLGGFLWRTFYYAVKKDPYLSKDPVICLMEKETVCVCLPLLSGISFLRWHYPNQVYGSKRNHVSSQPAFTSSPSAI